MVRRPGNRATAIVCLSGPLHTQHRRKGSNHVTALAHGAGVETFFANVRGRGQGPIILDSRPGAHPITTRLNAARGPSRPVMPKALGRATRHQSATTAHIGGDAMRLLTQSMARPANPHAVSLGLLAPGVTAWSKGYNHLTIPSPHDARRPFMVRMPCLPARPTAIVSKTTYTSGVNWTR